MMRRFRLPEAANLVPLTLDRHQRDMADRGEVQPPAAMLHLTLGQAVVDEDRVDRLQKELGRDVHHGEIFIIKIAVFFGGLVITMDQIEEEIPMRGKVPIEIHAHEATELQEPWIDIAQ